MKISNNQLVIATSFLVLTTLGCNNKKAESQNKEIAKPAAEVQTPAAEVKTAETKQIVNSTDSQILKVSETKYMVLPTKQVINTISLANNPIKENCKEISKLSHELNTLEDEKAKLLVLATEDESYAGSVDEAQAKIDEKSQELFVKKDAKFIQDMTYSKDSVLKNLATLRKANEGIVFELKQAAKTVLAVKSADGKVATQAILNTSDVVVAGAFDETVAVIKMKLSISYNALCIMKDLNSKALTSGSKSKLEMSFQD